jgi:hypothetical protein
MKHISDESYDQIMVVLNMAKSGLPTIDTHIQRERKLQYLAQEAKKALSILEAQKGAAAGSDAAAAA